MYNWCIDVMLKTGTTLKCEYDGPESHSVDVAKKLFHGKQPQDWVGLLSHKGTHNTIIVVGEIAAVDLYERK